MPRRRVSDYRAVLTATLELIKSVTTGGGGARVEEVVSDFEWAMWSGIRQTLTSVKHFGCAFHWSQCILRKIRNLRLTKAFTGGPTKKIIRQLMSLCYLPADTIPVIFEHLKSISPEVLLPLFNYMSRNWIYGKCWTPENWSVFMKQIRTNNDAEGLHNAWNIAAGRKMRFYKLAEFLLKLSSIVTIEVRLLTHNKIKRYVRKSSHIKEKILFDLWEAYQRNDFNTLVLLDNIVSDLNFLFPRACDPVINDAFDDEDPYDMDLINEDL